MVRKILIMLTVLAMTVLHSVEAIADQIVTNAVNGVRILKWREYHETDLFTPNGHCKVDGGRCDFDIPDSDTKTISSVQIWCNIKLQKSQKYDVSLNIHAENPGRIKVVYNLGKAPWTYLSNDIWLAVVPGNNQFSQTLTINENSDDFSGVLRMYFGGMSGKVTVDDVVVKEFQRIEVPNDFTPPYAEGIKRPGEKHNDMVDIWDQDRLDIPDYSSCRNILPNPSFESGLMFYTFPPDIGTYVPGYEDKYAVDKQCAKFGTNSLRIKTLRPEYAFDTIQSFAIPTRDGASYTLSFYAMGNMNGLEIKVNHITDHIWAQDKKLKVTQSQFAVSESWKRYVIHIQSHSTGYGFSFETPCNQEQGIIWIDGVQLEEGDSPTDYVQRPVTISLKTEDEQNFLESGQTINATLNVYTNAPGLSGVMAVKIKDFFYQETDLGSFDFTSNADSRAVVSIPLDKYIAGKKGVFVLTVKTTLSSGQWTMSYIRFSVMNKVNEESENKNIFSYHQLVIPDYEAGLKRWRDIGLGATNYFYYNFHNKLLFDLLKKYDIEDTCALLRQHWDSSLKDQNISRGAGNTIAILKKGAADQNPDILVQGMKIWKNVDQNKERNVREAAKKYAEYYNWRKNFAFDCEMNNQMIKDGNYEALASVLLACAKGVKEASVDNQVFLEGGAINLSSGISLTDNLLYACEKVDPDFRFDRFAVHAYGHPENEDFDRLFQQYLDVLDRHGYNNSPVFLNEGGYYAPYCINDWGLIPYRPLLMDHYHLWSISYDMGWGERISAAYTARAWLLALKYQKRIKQFNMWRPFTYLDCDLTPMAVQKVSNTLNRLLGNATFVQEIVFSAKSKAYVFQTPDNTPVVAIWGFENNVEHGLQRPPVIQMKTDDSVSEVLDLMENPILQRHDNEIMLPLSPFPVFLKGKPGNQTQVIEMVRNATVQGELSPPVQVVPLIKNSSTITWKVDNLLTRKLDGKLNVNQSDNVKQYPLAIESQGGFAFDMHLESPLSTGNIYHFEPQWQISSHDSKVYSGSTFLDAFLTIKTPNNIKVDGNLDDWEDIPYLDMTNYRDYGKNGERKLFSVQFKTTWDDDYLYLLVKIVDDHLFYNAPVANTAQVTNCDVLIVYLDTLCNGKESSLLRVDSDDYYYVFMPRPETHSALVYTQEACNQQLSLGVDAVQSRRYITQIKTNVKNTDDGYVYEIAFPQWTILPLKLKQDYTFGFGLYVRDQDDEKDPGRAFNLSYPNGSSCWRRADFWPQTILMNNRQ